MKLNRKTMIIAGAAVLAAVLIAVVVIIISATRKKATDNVQEPTTATDIMVVDITDKNGNSYKLEGVGVTDENGKTVITVTDESGNKTVITGDVSVNPDGTKTVTNATVTEGGKLVTSEGIDIDTEGATIGGIKDNNNGETATDIVVSADIVKDVLDKQEQASMEAASRAEAESREQAKNETESSNQRPTSTQPTEVHTKAEETEAATKAPTGGESTTAPTTKPTEAPTAPTEAPTQSAEEEFLANSELGEYNGAAEVYNYKGNQTDLTVPSYINGKPVKYVEIRNNSKLKTVTLPDTVTECILYSCSSLEIVNLGKGISTVNTNAVCNCASIKEINIAADSVVLMDGWCTTNTIYVPYFKGATLNFSTSPDRVKVRTSEFRDVYSTASDDVDGFINIVSFDCHASTAEDKELSKGMFGRVNFNVK